jgi:chemotaxis family two-component system sensor kinase Cph1
MGYGIDPMFSEKIFEVFQRLHLREEYEGTGIGLSICKKIIERYKGRIWFESELGKGTAFKFSIPKLK